MKIIHRVPALMAASVILVSHSLAAERKVNLSYLARHNGTWKSEFKAADGDERVAYVRNGGGETNGFRTTYFLEVDTATKKVVNGFFGYVTVAPGGKEFQGLYFSSDGWVATSSIVPTDKGQVIHVDVTTTNRSSFHATLHNEHQGDTAYTETWKDIIAEGNYTQQGLVRQYKKIEKTLRELRENGDIVFDETAEPVKELGALKRLLGRWEAVDSAGKTTHTLRWWLMGQNKWLVERWGIGTEQGGVNVTGIDPATGMLTLWSVSGDYMGRSGRWDVISDKVLGQVQGGNRLIREFPNDDTFRAHWQTLRAGSFVDVPADQAEPYTAKRIQRNN